MENIDSVLPASAGAVKVTPRRPLARGGGEQASASDFCDCAARKLRSGPAASSSGWRRRRRELLSPRRDIGSKPPDPGVDGVLLRPGGGLCPAFLAGEAQIQPIAERRRTPITRRRRE